MWDPQRYLAFADERGRPFGELMARVRASDPGLVVDLGCGPGNLTASLCDRWPDAVVVGVDSSEEMVAAARRASEKPEFVTADLRSWKPDRPVDVLVSNATLQWVPGHLDVVPELASWLAPGGWLAFQLPGNFGEPSHRLLRQVADSSRWRDQVGSHVVPWPASHEPDAYLATLRAAGLSADVWETTYLQVLPGEDAVLEWVTGTALRPILAALSETDAVEFRAVYGALLQTAYPRRDYGTVLPYRRIFAVAHAV